MGKEVQILNVRLPDDLIKELDNIISKGHFKSRSEALREFCREYLEENQAVLEEIKK